MGQQKKTFQWLTKDRFMWFLFAVAILINIKSIFADFDIDVEYATAMSYRMIRGDRMFLQMWEPHQTSAFLTTFLMKLFVAVTGDFTGVIIYLHAVGVLLHGAVTGLFYSFMKKRVELRQAQMMSIFLLVARPKDIVYPEYTNMQLWFSILLFLCILLYLENTHRKRWLLMGSFCLCMEAISYPSCVIVAGSVILLLWLYAEEKWKDICLFLGSCTLLGCAYIGFFAVRIGPEKLVKGLQNIVAADSSHQGSNRLGLVTYFEGFGESLLWIGICLLAAFMLAWIFSGKKRDGEDFGKSGSLLFCFSLLLLCSDVARALIQRQRIAYGAIYVAVVVAALFCVKYCDRAERRIVCAGMAISIGSFVGTILLTNLSLLYNVMYLVLAVAVSFLPLARRLPKETVLFHRVVRYNVLLLFCIGILLRRGGMVKTPSGFSSPLELGGIVKDGPAFGIVTDYMGACVINATLEEWDQYVYPGDHILIVGAGGVSTSGYLYGDTGVSVQSTICTPTYDEKLLTYWEEYPDKFPDCVIVQCWYGEPGMDSDSWIMQWIENEYQPSIYTDGKFWRYYRRDI